MALADDMPQLECGRAVEDVWARVDVPADEHEQHCEHCQRARDSLRRLRRAIEVDRSLPPHLEPGPSGRLRAGVMSIVRAEIRQGRRMPLEYPPAPPQQNLRAATTTRVGPSAREPGGVIEPQLAITERALTEVVRAAADEIGELRARRIRLVADPPPTDQRSRPTEPVSVGVAISVSVSSSASIPEIADVLRDRITAVVAERVGLRISRVDVVVEDAHDARAN